MLRQSTELSSPDTSGMKTPSRPSVPQKAFATPFSHRAPHKPAPVLPAKVHKARKPSPAPDPLSDPSDANKTSQSPVPAPALAPHEQTRSDVQAEKDQLSARIVSLKEHLEAQSPTGGSGILIRQREAMLALEAILDERLRTGELG